MNIYNLKNPITHMIEQLIHVIFDTQYNKYGKIIKKYLQYRHIELANYNLNPSMQPITVFIMIRESKELSEHAGYNITNKLIIF